MSTTTDTARYGGIRTALRRIEAWLDQRGSWAWIAAMVLGFIVFWPLGLALLAYMIWGKQMFARSCGRRRHAHDHALAHDHARDHAWDRHGHRAAQTTGNSAFDSYKAEALRRLEEEQEAFEAFLHRLRNSKDKAEFDAFMDERARATAAQDALAEPKAEPGTRPGEY